MRRSSDTYPSNAPAYNTSLVTRDLRGLADIPFDLLTVGAGIYGATIAWNATQRGLSVA